MTQLATDNFTRAAENPLSDGGSWAVQNSAQAFQLTASQKCTANNSTPACSSYFNGSISWPNDQYSECTLGAALASGQYIGLAVRCQAGSALNYYCVLITLGSNNVLLARSVSGTGTTLSTGTATFTVGDVIRLSVQGTTLTVYKNGTSILTATDSTYTSGFPGLASFALTNSVYFSGPWNGGSLVSPSSGTSDLAINSLQSLQKLNF